ncbi:MAG: S-layer homology domain-containing protein [Clostridia bacterium]|nr:S-layer homology domain-containing protein [Clostridia bacterium]
MKKLFMVFIIIFTFTTLSFSETGFVDLDNHWSSDYVLLLVEKGIISGYEVRDGVYAFKPEDKITVAEFVVLVMKSQNQMVEPFTSGYWATPWIKKAYDLGYIDEAYQNFERYITREEMADIAYNAISKNEYMSSVDEKYILDYVKDYASISEYKKDKVTSIYTMGIMSGTTEKKFLPLGSATRAEASVVLSRMIDITIRKPVKFDVPLFNYKYPEYDPVTATVNYLEGTCFAKTDRNGILQDEIVKAFEIFRTQINDFYTEELNNPDTTEERINVLKTADWTEFHNYAHDDRMEFGGLYDPKDEEFSLSLYKNMNTVEHGVLVPNLISYVDFYFFNFVFEGRNHPYHLEFNTYDDFDNWKMVSEREMMPYYEMLFEEDTQIVLDLAYTYMKKAPTDVYLQADKFNNYREVFTLKNGREISFFINKDGTVLNIGLDNK